MPKKLNLSPINVESFVTSLDDDEKKQVNGGVYTKPVGACQPDTRFGCSVDPQCPTISCYETCGCTEETCDTCNDCSYLCISQQTECLECTFTTEPTTIIV